MHEVHFPKLACDCGTFSVETMRENQQSSLQAQFSAKLISPSMKLTHFVCSGWVCVHTRCTKAHTYSTFQWNTLRLVYMNIQYCVNTRRHTLSLRPAEGSLIHALPSFPHISVCVCVWAVMSLKNTLLCPLCRKWSQQLDQKSCTGLGTVQVLTDRNEIHTHKWIFLCWRLCSDVFPVCQVPP